MNPNRERLRLLCALFDLSAADLGREIKLSRCLISRFLNGDDSINPRTLIARLEANLGRIVEKRRRAYFQVEAVPEETVRSALASIVKQVDAQSVAGKEAAA